MNPEMPKYVCHKVVHALKIAHIEMREGVGPLLLHPENPAFAPIAKDWSWVKEKHADERPGYYVVYEDGYDSWSPVEAFEKGYTLDGSVAQRYRVPKLSAESPWVTTLQKLMYAARVSSNGGTTIEGAIEEAEKLLKDGASLTCDPFEAALIDLSHAKDGRGLRVNLFSSKDYSSRALTQATKAFADLYVNESTAFLSYIDPAGYTKEKESKAAAAYWRNLALLANATAEAIEHETP